MDVREPWESHDLGNFLLNIDPDPKVGRHQLTQNKFQFTPFLRGKADFEDEFEVPS